MLAQALRIPPADTPAARWHVSAPVDLLAYAFSWIWVLVPLIWLGEHPRHDFLLIYLLVLSVTDIHRHYGLPYVFLDKEIFQGHPLRFTIFSLIVIGGFVLTPFAEQKGLRISLAQLFAGLGGVAAMVSVLRRDQASHTWELRDALRTAAWFSGFALAGLAAQELLIRPPRFRIREVYGVVAVFAALWNIWHVYNQKYGILRLYNAKSGADTKVPGWVDRLLIWGWLPLYLAWLSSRYGDYVLRVFPRGKKTLGPVFRFLSEIEVFTVTPCALLVVLSLACFIFYEWRTHRFRNAPRLWMAFGTTILASSFLWLHPLKAYVAYAFSHAIEYMVFVWAFQRRRYAKPLPHRPLLARVLRHPILAYASFTLGLGALFLYLKYYGWWIFADEEAPQAFGMSTSRWIGYWTVYQSMMHFYFDGFLWKMRAPAVRATI